MRCFIFLLWLLVELNKNCYVTKPLTLDFMSSTCFYTETKAAVSRTTWSFEIHKYRARQLQLYFCKLPFIVYGWLFALEFQKIHWGHVVVHPYIEFNCEVWSSAPRGPRVLAGDDTTLHLGGVRGSVAKHGTVSLLASSISVCVSNPYFVRSWEGKTEYQNQKKKSRACK